MKASEVLAFHKELHSHYAGMDQDEYWRQAYLAIDEVSLGPRSKSLLVMFVLRFRHCRLTYPLRVWVRTPYRTNQHLLDHFGGDLPTFDKLYREVVADIKDAGIECIHHIGDWPMRAKMRNCEGHTCK